MEEFIDYHKNLWEREAEAIREEEYGEEEHKSTNRECD